MADTDKKGTSSKETVLHIITIIFAVCCVSFRLGEQVLSFENEKANYHAACNQLNEVTEEKSY